MKTNNRHPAAPKKNNNGKFLIKMRLFFTLLSTIIFIHVGIAQKIPLKGIWTYKLDPENMGIEEQWFKQRFTNQIELPAALRDHNIGNTPNLKTPWTGSIYDSSWYFNPDMKKHRDIENPRFPFWLTPDKHYVGAAWYQKTIDIPASWKGKNIVLFLERPHWQTTLWFNNQLIDSQQSLSTPHIFTINLSEINPGPQTLTLRVDNAVRELDPGINSHSISDHTQGNWNGVTGDMYCEVQPAAMLGNIHVQTYLESATAKIKVPVIHTDKPSKSTLNFYVTEIQSGNELPFQSVEVSDPTDTVIFNFKMGKDFKTWSEFDPQLYQLKVELEKKGNIVDSQKLQFGMREFTIKEKHFFINGIPVFLRGTTDCCVFPLTGYPPTEEHEWARIFKICKSFGLNHMRFHSYCPPEAAFIAADKAGIYLQVEGPSWAKYSTTLGYGKPIDKYLMEETKRIIESYGNHPSFCMMAYGNEPSGNYVEYLENWVDYFKKYDDRFLYTGASTGRSWAIIENSEFIVRSPPRGLEWQNQQPQSQFDYRKKTENQQRPYVTFEMGQWCAFPNFKETEKYKGPLKARNFELFREDLADNHMEDQAADFLMASGKLQASCYKQEIEATLRTPNLAGFQLLSLNDFSGQGTALVGVLDAFWDEKGYISAKEFSSFCNAVVPLIRLPKYTFSGSDTLIAQMEVANFSGKELKNETVQWKLTDENDQEVGSGQFLHQEIEMGNCIALGSINANLKSIKNAGKYTISLSVGKYTNSWNIWIFPKSNTQADFTNIIITDTLNEVTKEHLNNGKKVLLLAAGKVENGKDVVQYFTPVFWNTSWFRMRPPHTTGIIIQNEHPVFNNFPTDYYSDLQWWELANKQQVMNIENFPIEFKPIVQPIDTWFLNRRLAMLFEAKVGKGSLMVCSINLEDDPSRIVRKQMRESILNYMQSEQFQPKNTVSLAVIEELFLVKQREGWKSYVKEQP